MAGWLDKLEKHGKQAKGRKRKADVVPAAPPPPVRSVIVTIRPANDLTGDPGMAAEGWYTVVDNLLQMTDENGKPLDGTKFTAAVTEANAHAVAARLTKARWADDSRGNDFNAPIAYGPLYNVV